MQQAMVFGWLALAAGWLGFAWPRGPVLTGIGLACLVLAPAVVFALEFAASRWVNRSDGAAHAGTRAYLRAWWAEIGMWLRVFCWRQPFRSRAVPDHLPANGRRGALLLHGFLCNRGFWNPWLEALRARDIPFIALDLAPVFGSIDSHAPAIEAAVQRLTTLTGRPPLLICHSMGGLAARAWLRDAGASRVHRIVTLASPHAGTWMARWGYSRNGRQMRPGGAWLRQLAGSAAQAPFTCWYADCDNMVFPASTATLPGADNRLAPGLAHVEMAFDPRVMRETLALLQD